VVPADAIITSPIMHSAGMGMGSHMGAMGMGAGGAGGGAGAFDEYGGVDPTLDPELAMAIRASTEEARSQEEARVRTSHLRIYF
jgi:26S proteasome regulatory subunit N10